MATKPKPQPPKTQKSKHPELEQKYETVRQFLDIWIPFFNEIRQAYKNRGMLPATAEDEERFLKIKSNCARRHQFLLDCVRADYIGGERITPILHATLTLSNIQRDYHDEFYRKVEKQWHTVLIHLYETVGHLKYKLENS